MPQFPFWGQGAAQWQSDSEVSITLPGTLLLPGLARPLSRVCPGSFVNEWQAGGDAAPAELIS